MGDFPLHNTLYLLNELSKLDDYLVRKFNIRGEYNKKFEKMKKDLQKINTNNLDDAVRKAYNAMLPCAEDEIEYGATICRGSGRNGLFFINKASVKHGVKQVSLVDCLRNGGKMCSAGCGGGEKPVAYIHTHGRLNGLEFSAADLYMVYKKQKPIYLVNSNGELWRSFLLKTSTLPAHQKAIEEQYQEYIKECNNRSQGKPSSTDAENGLRSIVSEEVGEEQIKI